MARFTIRVELHGANWNDYKTLADALANCNIVDELPVQGGGTWKMPPAEYTCTSDESVEAVNDIVQSCVDLTGRSSAILVTKSAGLFVSGTSSQA